MRFYYFSFTTLLIISAVFFVSCGFQNDTRAESLPPSQNTEQPLAKVETGKQKAEAQNRQILWDFRKPDTAEPDTFSKAETGAVVKYLFGSEANPEIEIRSRVSGSFTRPGVKETLYFLSGCEGEDGRFTTDCPHVSWNSAGWIAIYEGTRPVMKINEALGAGISAVTDINGDGINEILSFGGYVGSGITSRSAGLGQISGNKFINIQGFDGYFDNCADSRDSAEVEHTGVASVISYVPTTGGKMPAFAEEYFETKCSEESGNAPWKKITKKRFESFFEGL